MSMGRCSVEVCMPLKAVCEASLVEHRLQGMWASVVGHAGLVIAAPGSRAQTP